MIVYMIGRMLGVEGLLLLVPALVSFLYGKRNCIFIDSGHSARYFSAGGQKKTERYEYLWKRGACAGWDCLDFLVTVRCTAVFYLRFDSRLSGCLF